jgi:hypothetical protein
VGETDIPQGLGDKIVGWIVNREKMNQGTPNFGEV